MKSDQKKKQNESDLVFLFNTEIDFSNASIFKVNCREKIGLFPSTIKDLMFAPASSIGFD